MGFGGENNTGGVDSAKSLEKGLQSQHIVTAALSRTGRVAGPWLGSTPQVEVHMLLRAERPRGALCQTKATAPSPSSRARKPIRWSVCHGCPPQPGELTLPRPPPTNAPLNKSAAQAGKAKQL